MDPNKYAKNSKLNPNSPIHIIKAIIAFLLIILGILGIAYDLFKEGSGLRVLIGNLFDSTHSMILIPLLAVAIWLFNRWTTSPSAIKNPRIGDIPMYLMMGIGAFYIVRLLYGKL